MKKFILVVDDEAPTRELLNLFLRKRGYEVTSVATAEEAMQCVGESVFHLVILDIDLGTSNGLDLIKPLKTAIPEAPIIIFTGLGRDDSLVSRAYAEGAAGYITKTQPLDEMLAEIRHHLNEC
ncbi:MAG: response regulator [Verrucomicrobiia bacterium]|jgi:DNA-binding response OmpR family regulator